MMEDGREKPEEFISREPQAAVRDDYSECPGNIALDPAMSLTRLPGMIDPRTPVERATTSLRELGC
jgi:hypothetical protein